MKRFAVEKIKYSHCGQNSYEFAIVDKFNSCKFKGGFENEWQAIYWFINESGYTVVDLEH